MNIAVNVPDASLFTNYYVTKTKDIRNQIVCQNLYITEIIARKLYPIYQKYAEPEDMVHCGVIALMAAIDQFNPNLGVKFETYASIRIRGAILDYIRKQNWVPRTIWERAKELEKVFNMLHSKLGRDPSDEEMAQALNISMKDYNNRMKDAHLYTLMSYEEILADNYYGMDEQAQEENTPFNELVEKESKAELIKAIDGLSEKERLVITLYYYEELKLKEIAEIMEISESRICQINSKALMKLKNSLSSQK